MLHCIGGRGPFQAILSHFGKKNLGEKWGVPQFLAIFHTNFSNYNILTSVLTFLGGKIHCILHCLFLKASL